MASKPTKEPLPTVEEIQEIFTEVRCRATAQENEVLKKLLLDHFISEETLLPGELKTDRLRYLINLAEGEVLR